MKSSSAGVASTLPAASVLVTSTRCTPGVRPLTVKGEVQAPAAAPSTEQLNVVVSSEARKPTTAVGPSRTGNGGAGLATGMAAPCPPVTTVSGGLVSANNVLSNAPGPVSATCNWLPSRGGRKELWVAQPPPLSPHVMSFGVPLPPSV